MSDCAYQCISLRLPGRLFLFVVSGSRRLFVTTPPKSYATTQCNDINQSQLTVAVSTTCYITKTIWTFTQNNNYFRRQHDNDQIHACCIKGDLSLHKTRKQWKEFIHCYISSYREGHNHYHYRFMALFLGPPGWAGARRELLDFMVQGKIDRGRHTDHPAGRHFIRTNQCPLPPSLHIFHGPDALPDAQPTASKHWRQRGTQVYRLTSDDVKKSINRTANSCRRFPNSQTQECWSRAALETQIRDLLSSECLALPRQPSADR